MNYFILIPMVLLLSLNGLGQRTIKGRVVDKFSHEPLEFAIIKTGEKGPTAIADQQGNFELHLNENSDSITISYVGYSHLKIGIKNGEVPKIIEMTRGSVNLKEVSIQPLPNNGTFNTISRIDLNLHPINSAQDLMRLVPGLSLMQHQGGGIAEHIFYRGFDADHGTDVNVSVDGMPLNLVSHTHGQGFSDLHFLIPELVTNLEYGKGPYYNDHGDFTTAGYLAFKTIDVLKQSTVKLEAGQFNTGRLMAAINLLSDKAKTRGESAFIAGEGYYTDGPVNYPQHLNKVNLFGKYVVKLSQKNQLKLTFSSYNSNWRSSGEIPVRAVDQGLVSRWGFIDSAQGGNTNRTNAIIRLSSSLSDNLTLENQVYYSHYFFNLNYDATFFADDSLNGDQLRQHESRNLFGYNGRLMHHAYFKNNGVLTTTVGIGWQSNNITGSELSHTKNYSQVLEYIQHGDVREWTVGGFLDENYRIGNWRFNGGIRLDYLNFNYLDLINQPQGSIGKAIACPKLNVEYTFNDKAQVYLKMGKGFHSNDAKIVAANKGIDILPPAYGADLGLNWKPLPQLYINAAIWYLFLQQEFIYNADDGTFAPGNQTKREGIDLSARYEFASWLYANFDVNYCKAWDAQAPKGNNYLPLSVPLYSSAGLYTKLKNGLNGGISYRYMKDRPATSDNTLIAKGHFLTELTANYTKQKFEFGIEIQNLFNTSWRDAQFEVLSRLKSEPAPVDDISFTPGMPFFAKLKFSVFF